MASLISEISILAKEADSSVRYEAITLWSKDDNDDDDGDDDQMKTNMPMAKILTPQDL